MGSGLELSFFYVARRIFAIVIFAVVILFGVVFQNGFHAQENRVIKEIKVEGPFVPFESHGDLWFSTWADDDSVFVSWGDGTGPNYKKDDKLSHHGLARLTGNFPNVKAEVVKKFMPLSDDVNNSKPTSLLFLDKRLYIAIHTPLLFPKKGFIAYSDDYGKTYKYDADGTQRTKEKKRKFICLIFLNMGKAYTLNTDGYVYAFGMSGEVNSSGKVFLARMKKEKILDEASWDYFAGMDDKNAPKWSKDYKDTAMVQGLSKLKSASLYKSMILSAMYHPHIKRYVAMTATFDEGELFESPTPWGPWTFVAKWFQGKNSPWYSMYMPGLITKDLGPDYFYFTAAGRVDLEPQPGDKSYRFLLGKVTMLLKP